MFNVARNEIEHFFDRLARETLKSFFLVLILIYSFYMTHRLFAWTGWSRATSIGVLLVAIVFLALVRKSLLHPKPDILWGGYHGIVVSLWVVVVSSVHFWVGLEPRYTNIVCLVVIGSGVLLLHKTLTLVADLCLVGVWTLVYYAKTGGAPAADLIAVASSLLIAYFFLIARRKVFTEEFLLLRTEQEQNELLRQTVSTTEQYRQELENRIPDWAERAKQAQQELRQMTKEHLQLSQRVEELGSGDPVGQLAGGVAHDLNNLLFVLNINLEDLSLGDDPDILDFRDSIRASCLEMEDIVSQLLAFSRKQKMARKQWEAGPLLDDFVFGLGGLLSENIKLNYTVEQPDTSILIDKPQFFQAVLNLCLNAADAMPDGGTLSLRGERQANSFIVSVEDNGQGMDERTSQLCVEPFFTTKGLHSGRGLGLSVVNGIISQHGGSLDIQSRPGQGTTARLILPMSSEANSKYKTVFLVGRNDSDKVLLNKFLRYNRFSVQSMEGRDLRHLRLKAGQSTGIILVKAGCAQAFKTYLLDLKRDWPSLSLVVVGDKLNSVLGPPDQRLRYISEPYSLSELLSLLEQLS